VRRVREEGEEGRRRKEGEGGRRRKEGEEGKEAQVGSKDGPVSHHGGGGRSLLK
jgi:hypothetical protein